jgi:hypothetical protein
MFIDFFFKFRVDNVLIFAVIAVLVIKSAVSFEHVLAKQHDFVAKESFEKLTA